MNALQIECQTREWWGRHWPHPEPYVLDAHQTSDAGLPNAPVSIAVMTRNAGEAAQLLRIAADALEREPEMLERLPEPFAPVEAADGEEQPF